MTLPMSSDSKQDIPPIVCTFHVTQFILTSLRSGYNLLPLKIKYGKIVPTNFAGILIISIIKHHFAVMFSMWYRFIKGAFHTSYRSLKKKCLWKKSDIYYQIAR